MSDSPPSPPQARRLASPPASPVSVKDPTLLHGLVRPPTRWTVGSTLLRPTDMRVRELDPLPASEGASAAPAADKPGVDPDQHPFYLGPVRTTMHALRQEFLFPFNLSLHPPVTRLRTAAAAPPVMASAPESAASGIRGEAIPSGPFSPSSTPGFRTLSPGQASSASPTLARSLSAASPPPWATITSPTRSGRASTPGSQSAHNSPMRTGRLLGASASSPSRTPGHASRAPPAVLRPLTGMNPAVFESFTEESEPDRPVIEASSSHEGRASVPGSRRGSLSSSSSSSATAAAKAAKVAAIAGSGGLKEPARSLEDVGFGATYGGAISVVWERHCAAVEEVQSHVLRVLPADISALQRDFVRGVPIAELVSLHDASGRLPAPQRVRMPPARRGSITEDVEVPSSSSLAGQAAELVLSTELMRVVGLAAHFVYWRALRPLADGASLPPHDDAELEAALVEAWVQLSLRVDAHGPRHSSLTLLALALFATKSLVEACLRAAFPRWSEHERTVAAFHLRFASTPATEAAASARDDHVPSSYEAPRLVPLHAQIDAALTAQLDPARIHSMLTSYVAARECFPVLERLRRLPVKRVTRERVDATEAVAALHAATHLPSRVPRTKAATEAAGAPGTRAPPSLREALSRARARRENEDGGDGTLGWWPSPASSSSPSSFSPVRGRFGRASASASFDDLVGLADDAEADGADGEAAHRAHDDALAESARGGGAEDWWGFADDPGERNPLVEAGGVAPARGAPDGSVLVAAVEDVPYMNRMTVLWDRTSPMVRTALGEPVTLESRRMLSRGRPGRVEAAPLAPSERARLLTFATSRALARYRKADTQTTRYSGRAELLRSSFRLSAATVAAVGRASPAAALAATPKARRASIVLASSGQWDAFAPPGFVRRGAEPEGRSREESKATPTRDRPPTARPASSRAEPAALSPAGQRRVEATVGSIAVVGDRLPSPFDAAGVRRFAPSGWAEGPTAKEVAEREREAVALEKEAEARRRMRAEIARASGATPEGLGGAARSAGAGAGGRVDLLGVPTRRALGLS